MGDPDPYFDAHKRYQGERDAALALTWRDWQPKLGPNLKLWPIDEAALEFVDQRWTAVPAHPDGDFRWRDYWYQIRSTPRRFDLAVWENGLLLGLAIGMCSRGPTCVTIKAIERWAIEANPYRGSIAGLATSAADHYAGLLGKRCVRIKNPAEGAIRVYEGLGFRFAHIYRGSTYYERKVMEP